MAETLPVGIILEKNKLFTDSTWYILLDVTINNLAKTKLYYVKNMDSVTYGGNTYTPIDFDVEISKEGIKGEIPVIQLKIQNVDRIVGGYVEAANGGIGTTVLISVINGGALALQREYSVIGSSIDGVGYVTFSLGAPNLLRQRYPLYRYIADSCPWWFKAHECKYEDPTANRVTGSGGGVYVCYIDHVSASDNCPVTGANWMDYWRISTGSASTWSAGVSYSAGTATCDRNLDACRDYSNTINYGGAKGLTNRNTRVV
jgi:hypothetical protein